MVPFSNTGTTQRATQNTPVLKFAWLSTLKLNPPARRTVSSQFRQFVHHFCHYTLQLYIYYVLIYILSAQVDSHFCKLKRR